MAAFAPAISTLSSAFPGRGPARLDMQARHVGRHRGWARTGAEVQAPGLPVLDAPGVEQVGTTDQVVELADAELGHDLAHFLGDEEEVVDDMLGLAG